MDESLLTIIEKNGINLEVTHLPINESAAFLYEGDCYIVLDTGLKGADEKVHLAHEVGHCITGSFYNVYSPLDVRGKHERHADEWAISHLIPAEDYLLALHRGIRNAAELAEEFNLTEVFCRKVIEYYRKKLQIESEFDEVC